MMRFKNFTKHILTTFSVLLCSSTFAFDFDGVYILGGVGYAGVDRGQFAEGVDITTVEHAFHAFLPLNGEAYESAGNFAWRGGFGAWLNDNFALEFNYFGINEMDDSFSTTKAPMNGTVAASGDMTVKDMMFFDISSVARYFFDEDFWGFVRGGFAIAKVERFVSGQSVKGSGLMANASFEENEWGVGFALGVGAQYDFTDMFGLRIEANTVQATNDNDMYGITASIVVNFENLM